MCRTLILGPSYPAQFHSDRNNCVPVSHQIGPHGRNRTHNPAPIKSQLYQLSYTRIKNGPDDRTRTCIISVPSRVANFWHHIRIMSPPYCDPVYKDRFWTLSGSKIGSSGGNRTHHTLSDAL
jgi:hypothetical protein